MYWNSFCTIYVTVKVKKSIIPDSVPNYLRLTWRYVKKVQSWARGRTRFLIEKGIVISINNQRVRVSSFKHFASIWVLFFINVLSRQTLKIRKSILEILVLAFQSSCILFHKIRENNLLLARSCIHFLNQSLQFSLFVRKSKHFLPVFFIENEVVQFKFIY